LSGIVVDASIALSWCFPDEQTSLSIKILDMLKAGESAVVPSFWCVEVLNTLLVGEKRGRIKPEQTEAFLGDLRTLAPLLDFASFEQVCGVVQKISREHRLTPYDALYVELALRTGCRLATLDHAQREAAAALGIECL
jgi:predicted nucleic acid-binding protein